MTEPRYRRWRTSLWQRVRGRRVLEVGVGTGKNIPHWPRNAHLTAIDLTSGMMDIARRRAERLGWPAHLRLGDVQALDFEDGSFDTAVATFVFCSVPDPVQGLRGAADLATPILLRGTVPVADRVRAQRSTS